MDNKKVKIVISLLFVGILACTIAYTLYPYMEFFLAALILYSIIDPVYKAILHKTRLAPDVAAIALIALIILVIIIPLYYLFVLIAGQINQILPSVISLQNIVSRVNLINMDFETVNKLIAMFSLDEKISDIVANLGSYLSTMLIGAIQNIGTQVIGVVIMFFLLYYLLTTDDAKLWKIVHDVTPFSNKNTSILLKEMKNIIHSTVIATLLIAVVQGSLLTLTFYAAGIQGALFWGFITGILSIIPVVGPPVIWGPAIVIKLIEADYSAAVIVLIGGLILSNIDNLLRPLIQRKVGSIHPLVSLLGIFIGISLFGLVGIIVGPMLLAIFLLMLKIVNEEFLQT